MGYEVKNPLRAQSKHGLIGSSAKQERKRCTFLGSFGMGQPPACTSNLVYMCAEGFRGHKSSNRIQLSQFVHVL